MADPFKARNPFAPWDRRELPGMFDVEETEVQDDVLNESNLDKLEESI